ncbi:MAG: DcaP family trimeric outer membrane transporter [Pseudomonadota bacterium]
MQRTLSIKQLETSGYALAASFLVILSPAFAQASDDGSVEELRAEVEELRALVEALAGSQGVSVVVDGRGASQHDDTVVSIPETRAPSRDGLEAASGQTSGTGVLSARQPIGRFPDDAIVTAGEFDRSVRVPGTNGAFRLGGAVQINANYDTDNQGFQQIGTQPTIPIDGTVDDGDEQFSIHARHSRINFDFRAPTQYGQLRTFIEFDFFGDGDEFTNDYDLRLRHAAAELGPWKFGQFWSGFVDVFNIPETADPGGPMAQPVLRNPGIHYVRGRYDGSNWGIGIENPAADLGGNTDLIASESVPSVVAFAKLQRDWGYIRIAGMSVELKSDEDSVITGGAHLSGRFNSPLPGSDRNNFSFGAQAGEGFVHHFSSFVGELDGVVLDNGDVEATGIIGAFGAYQHFWTERWRSTFTASLFELDSPNTADPLLYSGGERFSANLFFSPLEGVTFGLEGNYNTIETVDGSEGEGTRIEFVGRFDF